MAEPVEVRTLTDSILRPLTAEPVREMNERALAAQKRERQRERESLLSRATHGLHGLGSRYSWQAASLDTFRVTHPEQCVTVNRLKLLTGSLTEASKLPNMVFFGTVGTGKDHLLAACLWSAARAGIICRWINGQELYGAFRDRMDTQEREADLLDDLSRPDVLAISDPIPPVGEPSPWNLNILYRLIDRRYRNCKPTWVTMNATSAMDADKKLGALVFDRLREGAEMFPCFWPSFREGKK